MRVMGKPGELSPLAAEVMAAPQSVVGSDKRRHLVYEVALVNSAPITQVFKKVKVMDPERHRVLAKYDSPEEMRKIMTTSTSQAPGTDELAPNGAGFLFINVTLKPGSPMPDRLVHRVKVRVPEADASFRVQGAKSRVNHRTASLISPPLVGKGWLNVNGCCDKSPHTRAIVSVDGVPWLAQRYAIDWIRADKQDRIFRGDFRKNKNWVCFKDPIVSVSRGVVVQTFDELEENTPPVPRGNLNAKTALGNHVVVRMPDGRYATYAHMHTGSVRVDVGDHVRPGQLLGLIGNTGSSTAPHLHFHVTAAASVVASSGTPYTFTEFRFVHRIENSDELGADIPAQVAEYGPAPSPRMRHAQLPLTGTAVTFRGHRKAVLNQ
jgi:hypothetical protein